jgi:hypothetical protein
MKLLALALEPTPQGGAEKNGRGSQVLAAPSHHPPGHRLAPAALARKRDIVADARDPGEGKAGDPR